MQPPRSAGHCACVLSGVPACMLGYFVRDFLGQLGDRPVLFSYACQQAVSPACVRCGVTVSLVRGACAPGPWANVCSSGAYCSRCLAATSGRSRATALSLGRRACTRALWLVTQQERMGSRLFCWFLLSSVRSRCAGGYTE